MSIFFFAFLLLSCFTLDWVKIDPKTRQFVDSNGRTIIFHGVNAVYKIPPFIPNLINFDTQHSLNEKDAQDLSNWGVNIVRLGIEWPGVNPSQGLINNTYLDLISQMVNMLGKYGIYTLLDNHQDLLSRFFCGEGIPDYVEKGLKPSKDFPKPLPYHIDFDPQTGYPTLETCYKVTNFGEFYLTDKASKAFQEMYTSNSSIYSIFLQYWDTVSKYFANNPNVVAYELINEPWVGDIYSYPKELLESGYSDKNFLKPLYDNLNQIIRKNDPNHVIFFESSVADYYDIGFTEGPGGKSYDNKNAFSYHIYCPFVNKSGVPTSEILCHQYDSTMMNLRFKDSKALGLPGIITEFGALDQTLGALKEANYIMNIADSQLTGYIYWTFKSYEDITTANQDGSETYYLKDGTLQTEKVKTLSRTYPQFVFGNLISYSFNPDNKDFSLTFTTTDSHSQGKTIIYYNKAMNYPNGINYDISEKSIQVTFNDFQIILTQIQYLPSGQQIKINIHKI